MKLIKEKIIVDSNIKINFFSNLIASGFYTGYAPKASGTFGSAFAILFFLIPGFNNSYLISVLIFFFIFAGIITSNQMVKRFGDDPSVVVIDEIVGMWLTMLIANFYQINIYSYLIGFFAFRFFDIAKIFPASYFDKIKNGLGIMMDDIIAGLYAGFATVGILFLINKLF